MQEVTFAAHWDRRLVVVSNRGPYVRREVRGVPRWVRTVGGVASALDPVLRGRQGVWLHGAEPGASTVPPSSVAGYEIATVPLTASEVDGYYRRVSNGVLWPLLHSFPTRVRTHDAPWRIYREVNRRFAEHAAHFDDDATYWIHDFQLALVPREVRKRRPHARIGWFCHVPWPAPEVFATLPERDEALEGVLGADVVGFQTPRDARNFLRAIEELTGHPADFEAGEVRVSERRVRVRAFPIGIDVDAVQALASSPYVRSSREHLRTRLGSQRVLLAIDRLDYTKGIPERLRAFGEMLRRHPHLIQRVSLVQVAVPSRTEVPEYAALKREVDELVGQINGRYARPGWTAVQYLYRSFELADLVALYGLADVAVVTPLRDGMNLVAHEFAAARLDNSGVLVLSEFAGAAAILDGAVLVNPYDITRTADVLASALAMPESEKSARMARCRLAVRRHRVGLWQSAFLTTLEHEVESSGASPAQRPPDASAAC